MGINVPFGVGSASEIAARDCHESFDLPADGNILPPEDWFMQIVHGLWKKPAAWLRYLTGLPERTCRSAASGDTQPSGLLLYMLLRSRAGRDITKKIMQGAEADWFRRLEYCEQIVDGIEKTQRASIHK